MTRAAWVVVAVAVAGCGGRQNLLLPPEDDAGATPSKIGTVDLSEAPSTLPTTCDHGIGSVTFDDPCLVGVNLANTDPTSIGLHAVECHLEASAHPVAWSFTLPLARVVASPDATYAFPTDLMRVPEGQVDVGGQPATVSSVSGTMTFSRVDPTMRSFAAHLTGTILWTGADGTTFQCVVDAPLWGAPGTFK